MAFSNSDGPMRAATPELEPEPRPRAVDWLLRRTSKAHRRRGDEAATSPVVPASKAAPTQDEIHARMRQQAHRIDQILHDGDMQDNWQNIMRKKGEFKYLDLRLDITPDHREWQQEYARFKNLISSESIQNVLNRNFKPWQQHFLLPPVVAGEILKLQNKNTKKYKEALQGQFSSAKDNIITKLTMVHFGLPVEPLTLNNILHADKDENDAEDPPEEPARVQRIIYSEAPLEFLDGYDQRGHGYAMIRRKTNLHLRGAGADQIDLQNANLDGSADEAEIVHIRGGAARKYRAPTIDEPEEATEWYLYGTNGRIQMAKTQDSEAFRINASRFLGTSLPQDHPWEFVVDQYKRDDKDQTIVSHFNTGTQGGSFVVSNVNYHDVWETYLKPRVFDEFGKWVMIVNASRNGARAPATFQIRLEEPPPLLSPDSPLFKESWRRSVLKPSKTSTTAASGDKESTRGPTRKAYYMLPNEDPVEFEVENDYKDFKSKVRAGLGLAKRDHFYIVFYSKQLDESNPQNQYLYSHFTVSGESHYVQHVAPKLFGTEDEWIVVAVANENDAPKDFWPPGSAAPAQVAETAAEPVGSVPETVPIWHSPSERYEVKNSHFNFADVASRALKVDHEPEWTIYIDMYKLQFDNSTNEHRMYFDYSGPVQGSFNQPLDSQFTDYFAPRLFDPAQNWGARIRLENEETLPELWFDNFTHHSGVLYGYAGQLETTSNYEDFKHAALDLLSLSDDSNWEFTISCPTLQSKHNDVTKSNFQDFFNRTLQPILDANPWRVFVRTVGTAPPTSKEPHLGILSIVRLHLAGRGTAYWKLPADMAPHYGINQFQEDFFRANRILFPKRLPRPAKDVKISFEGVEFNIGFGGMFLTRSLFDALQSYIGSVSYARSIELTVKLSPSQATRPFSLRQAGSEIRSRVFDLGQGRSLDLGAVYDEIVRMSKQSIELSSENQLPAAFRLWRTAEDRESDGPSVVLSYKPENKQQALAKLSDWLGDPFDLRSTCFWFRPEYILFMIRDVDDPSKPEVIWKAAANNRQLSGFRSMLDNYFNDGDPASSASFVVEDLETVDEVQRQRFVISASDTANGPWRGNVLDCMLRNVSLVKRNANINYVIDQTSLWGVTEEAAAPAWPKPSIRASPPTPPPSSAPPTPRTPRGNPGGRQAAASKFNQPRLLKPQAGTPIYSAYKPWIAEQNRQNDKKHRSWSEDISVIEPGQKPEVNIFGTHKELMESVSSNFPIHFGQIVTSTDNMKLQEENRQLRMLVLDRIHKCYWCETTFPLYETGKITEHMAQHRAVMEEGGLFCPMCGSEDWIHMNTAQRREHLIKDADGREGETIKNFWKDLRCLVCDTDLADVKPELVIRHFATHIPGVLKFCDRCGRNEYNFVSDFERMHHDRVCLQSDQAYAEPRVFCNRCGANQTGLSMKKKRNHDKICSVRDGGKHCYICGLDLSPWTTRDERQCHIDNCRSPAGPPRGYCTRCGIDRLNMSALETAAHEQECYMSEPIKRIQERRVRDIDDKWNETLDQRAKLRKERAQFHQMQDDALDSEVGPCQHCGEPFAGKDRQYIADHYRDWHAEGGGSTAAPLSVPCPYRRPGDLFCDVKIGPPVNPTTLRAYLEHVKRDHQHDICTPEQSKQCPFGLAQGKGKCKFEIKYPLRGDNVDQFFEHYELRHVRPTPAVVTIPCPYRNADGQTTKCDRGPFRLDDGGEDLIHHLREAHFINGNTEVVCPLELLDESACNEHVSLHNDAEELFTHIRDVHASAPTASHSHTPVADAFTCSLSSQTGDKDICGVAIDTPTTAASRLAFSKHYQHAPGAGGPDSRTVLHVFNEFQRQLQDNLLHARDEHVAIVEEGQDATSIVAEINLINTQLANLTELINDLDHEYDKPVFADAAQLARDAQTGFEPSPINEVFPPPTPHPRGRKRKATGDLPVLKRMPGETALQYNNRLKRQRTGPNVVSYAGANEDESARPRGRVVVLPGEGGAKKGESKDVEGAGDADADADGEKKRIRQVRIKLSEPPKSKKRTHAPAPTLTQTQAQTKPSTPPPSAPNLIPASATTPTPKLTPTTTTTPTPTTKPQEQEQEQQQDQGSLATPSQPPTRTRTRTRIFPAKRTNAAMAAALAAADARRSTSAGIGSSANPDLGSSAGVGVESPGRVARPRRGAVEKRARRV